MMDNKGDSIPEELEYLISRLRDEYGVNNTQDYRSPYNGKLS